MRVIFTGASWTSRNWSLGHWSRHVNSLQSFTAHTVPTQIVQGQHDHTRSAQGSYTVHGKVLHLSQRTVCKLLWRLRQWCLSKHLLYSLLSSCLWCTVHCILGSILLPVCLIPVSNWPNIQQVSCTHKRFVVVPYVQSNCVRDPPFCTHLSTILQREIYCRRGRKTDFSTNSSLSKLQSNAARKTL